MKIILFGSSGQVGKEIKKKLSNTFQLICFNRIKADFLYPKRILEILDYYKPNIIINAAAYTKVDNAENNEDICFKINAEILKFISEYSNKNKSLLIHFSSEYVFDGLSNIPYNEEEKMQPKSIYGNSKMYADNYIKNSECPYLILRTSWVYGDGINFINKIIDQIKSKKKLFVVDDQIGSPTPSTLLAEIILKLINFIILKELLLDIREVFNICPKGYTSRYNLACFIKSEIDIKTKDKLIKIKSNQLQNNIRPLNSMLNISKISNFINVDIAHWSIYLEEYLKTYD